MSPPGFGRLSSAGAFSVVAVFGFSGFTRRCLAGHRHLSFCRGELQYEVDRLFLPQA